MTSVLEITTLAPVDRDGTMLELNLGENNFLTIEMISKEKYRFYLSENESVDLSMKDIQNIIEVGKKFLTYNADI